MSTAKIFLNFLKTKITFLAKNVKNYSGELITENKLHL